MSVFKALIKVVEASLKFCFATTIIMSSSALRRCRCFIHNGALATSSIQWAVFLLSVVTRWRGAVDITSFI